MFFSPIIVFVYNRPEHARQTLEAISANTLAMESDLFIFSDGPKENANGETLEKIRQTREIAHSKKWCKNVTVIESEKNKGLAASIISSVTDISKKYGKVIVLEDDIVTGKYFLEFMNAALNKYENEKNVWHITGWRDPVKNAVCGKSYFYPTMDCWGWATWADRWQYYKKDALFYKQYFSDKMIFHFNIEGAEPGKWAQIEGNISGKINTWAIFWSATIFVHNGLCLGPSKSIVKNIGFDGSGEHCKSEPKLKINDSINIQITDLPELIEVDKDEYNKNINFYKLLYKKPFWKRMFIFIKKELRGNELFSPLYYRLKKYILKK